MWLSRSSNSGFWLLFAVVDIAVLFFPVFFRSAVCPDRGRLCLQAGCCVVSSRSNSFFDAYVLSESSLFVYPDKVILKTCGTTKLLAAVPLLLDLAAGIGLRCRRCKYSRGSFLFPHYQVVAQRVPQPVAHPD